MTLLIDNYDSFTYNLYDYIRQLNHEVTVVKNDAVTISQLDDLEFSNIILSPGPNTPNEAGITMDVIDKFHKSVPILGICLGHQAIGQYFNATLVKSDIPMHGKTSPIFHQSHALFNGLNNPFSAMRYHSLVLKDIPSELEIIANTEDDIVMGIQHRIYPTIGIQFHPESIITENGITILKNWFNFIQ